MGPVLVTSGVSSSASDVFLVAVRSSMADGNITSSSSNGCQVGIGDFLPNAI